MTFYWSERVETSFRNSRNKKQLRPHGRKPCRVSASQGSGGETLIDTSLLYLNNCAFHLFTAFTQCNFLSNYCLIAECCGSRVEFGSRVDIERDKTLIFGSTLKDNGLLPMLVITKNRMSLKFIRSKKTRSF